MTPEGYEEAQLGGTERNQTKGEKNNQSHKPTKLETSASSKQDSDGHPLKGIEAHLPEPQYRTVAGHVSRRANTSVAADPPPPPAPSRATSSDQRSKQRKKPDGGGFGDDSDDSDPDDKRRGQDNGSPSATGRRSRPRAQNDHEPSSASASSRPVESFHYKPMEFNVEEQGRLDRRRKLSFISSIWENKMQLRSQNSEQAAKRKTRLMDYLWAYDCRRPGGADVLGPENIDCQRLDERLGEFLEHSLHWRAIYDITQMIAPVMQFTYQFIRELEKEIIQRCEEVHHARHAESVSTPQRERNMALLYMAALVRTEPVIGEPTNFYCGYEHSLSPSDLEPDIVNTFAEALIKKMMRCAEKGRDYLKSPLKEALSVDASDEERTRFALLNRQQRGITNVYKEWLCEDVDIDSIKNSPRYLHDGLRAMQRLKALKEGFRQEFIGPVDVFTGVSSPCALLVVFKGNQPLRSQFVAASDLSDIGWNHEKPKPILWRSSLLEGTVTGESEMRKAVFKVDMDGAVLAIQGSDGQWIDWEDIRGGE